MAQQRRANAKPHGDTYKPSWKVYGTYESSRRFCLAGAVTLDFNDYGEDDLTNHRGPGLWPFSASRSEEVADRPPR